MRVLVCGSRDWGDGEVIYRRLSALPGEHQPITIVHGACSRKVGGVQKSADMLADLHARQLGFQVECHPADWDRHGRGAGFIRNAEMAKSGIDLALAFHRAGSNGTSHMINEVRKRGIPVEVFRA